MMQPDFLVFEQHFKFLGTALLSELREHSLIKTFAPHTELVREGHFVRFVPIVLEGLVKVYTRIEEKEMLLYYIKQEQSCIMSFSACQQNNKSVFFAITEEETKILLIPCEKITQWVIKYPIINSFLYQQYDMKYHELVEAIHQMMYHKLDKRLLSYLDEKMEVTGKNPIKITHKEIAHDLGTAREVVSRLIKKLEKQKIIKQHHDCLEIIGQL